MACRTSFPASKSHRYSYNVAGAHVFVLNAYIDTGPGSAQYAWLEQDLKSVDRSVTPWIISASHCPWYNSNQVGQEPRAPSLFFSSLQWHVYSVGVLHMLGA